MLNSRRRPHAHARLVQLALVVLLGTTLYATVEPAAGAEPATATLATRFRQPVAACLSADGGRLYVANQRSGSISVIDATSARTVAEHDVGRGLADIALVPQSQLVIAVDQAGNSLLLIDLDGPRARVLDRLDVSDDPAAVVVSSDGRRCVVASRSSRRLTFVDRPLAGSDHGAALRIAGTLDVPFSPRELALVRDDTMLVAADAYGGRLAVVDVRGRSLKSVRSLPAHNIRGLAVTPDGNSLVVAHQVLLHRARTTYEDIHWGLFVNNDLRVLELDGLLGSVSDRELVKTSREVHLGDPGQGSGDPGAVAFDRKGHLVVALAGVDEVMIGTEPEVLPYRPRVGRRPVDVALAADGKVVYAVNSLDDTVSVVDLASGRRRENIPLGPTSQTTAAERGERLFSDARLSHDGWMSCHSCHTDGHTSGLNSDTLGDGGFGAPKRIPSLLGAGQTGPWGWTGRFETLEDQVRQSIASTMQGQYPNEAEVGDLVAYIRTLKPPAPARIEAVNPAVSRGRTLFERTCVDCHAPPVYTVPGRFDVGLVDEKGNRKFNPPSLRGVGRTEPLLHDGRATSLEEVFKTHHHPSGTELTDEQVADLVAFLRTL